MPATRWRPAFVRVPGWRPATCVAVLRPRGNGDLQLVTRFGWAGARPAGRQPQGSAAALAAAHHPLLQDGGNMPPVPLSAKFKIFDWLVFLCIFSDSVDNRGPMQ